MIAELLGFNCVTAIIGFAYDNGTITIKRELEGGLLGVVRLPLPALLTCQSGLNVPRYPTLPNILKAKRKEIRVIPVADLPATKPVTTASAFRKPLAKGSPIIINGELDGVADRVAAMLREKGAAISGRRG
jgi:electron transfer flavoprotein beta subunit